MVAADLPAEELAATLREGAGPLCESVRLFDVYTGPQVGEGHRSLAFALRFRAPDRTLTEKETAAARESAVALAARAPRRAADESESSAPAHRPGPRHQRDRAVRCDRQPRRQGGAERFASLVAQRRDVPGRRTLTTEER